MQHTELNATASQHAAAPRRAWMGLVATLGPVLMVAMDGSILFLAMPRINEALSPSTNQSLWILDVYGFVVGALLITFGNLGDRIGRKKLLLGGAALFGVGSFCAAFAPSAGLLIGFRAVMGLGGATLLPSCLAVISELFDNPAQRAQAIGIFAATFAAGFVIGPIAGGVLLDRFSWGAVFLINIPVIAVFLIAAPVLLREVHGGHGGKLDLASVALSASGLAIAIYGVKNVAAYGTSWTGCITIAVGGVITGIFLHRQRKLEHPLLDLSLFKRRVFAVAILTGVVSLFVWSAAAYLSMTYLQSILGRSVISAAMLAIPGAIVLTGSCVLTPRLVDMIGVRRSLITCHLSMGLGLAALLFTGVSTGAVFYVASTVIAGIGFGISFSLVADTAVGAVPESRAGSAGAIAETSNEIGNALGIALLGSLLTLVFRWQYDGDETGIGEVVDAHSAGTPAFEHAQSAFISGFHTVAAVAALVCLCLGLLAISWIPKRAVPVS